MIEGLQNLEGSINAGKGLTAYLTENKPTAETEIFVITEPTTLKTSRNVKGIKRFSKRNNLYHPS